MDETHSKCRRCHVPLTLSLGVWWDDDDDRICPETGDDHMAYRVTVLPPVEAWNTGEPARKRDRNASRHKSRHVIGATRDTSKLAERRNDRKER